MDRRDFLKACGKAGLAVSAGGVLSQALVDKLLAEGEAAGGPPLIHLKGTPREMGKQYAQEARDLIKERLKLLREKGSKVVKDSVEMSRIFLNVMANSILQEIEAMAESLDEDELDLLTLSAEPPGVGIRTGGCSSFILDKSVAKDDRVWMGQNVDDAAALEKFGVVLIRHPLEQPPMITWALAGGVGGIGMNIHGSAILMNYVQTAEVKQQQAIFPEFIANAALRQKEFKDLVGVLMETQVMSPVTYLVANPAGERMVIERTPLRYAARTPPQKFAAYTNHFVEEKMRGDDTTAKVFPDSKARLKRLETLLLNKKGVATPDFLKQVLADTEGKPNGICRHAAPPTIASIILCPKDLLMLATKGGPDREKYREFVLTMKE